MIGSDGEGSKLGATLLQLSGCALGAGSGLGDVLLGEMEFVVGSLILGVHVHHSSIELFDLVGDGRGLGTLVRDLISAGRKHRKC